MDTVYLDNNATTRPAPEVVETVMDMLVDRWGNPSSGHPVGQRAAFRVEHARRALADCLGAQPHEIVFTSGGTESDILAIEGALAARAGTHWVTAATEHDAVVTLGEHLEGRGITVTRLEVDAEGQIDPGKLDEAIRPDTAIVSLMLANNETGVLLPIAELAARCRSRGVLFHTDAVQALGKIPVRVDELGVDLLSVSSHKVHGPKGTGALYVRSGTALAPMIVGGHQERDLRGGTENAPGIAGFGTAVELVGRFAAGHADVRALRDRFEASVLELAPARIVGAGSPRLPNTACIAFDGLRSEQILVALAEQGVYASGGSACHAGSLEPSRVLRAMGLPRDAALGGVRFSLSRETSPREVDRALAVLADVLERLGSSRPAPADR